MELSVIPDELVVRDDLGSVASEPARWPPPELDIEASVVTCVDQDQVEGGIPTGFGMYDHRVLQGLVAFMITFLDSLLNHLLQNFVDVVSLVCLEYERYYLNDWVGIVMRIITK